MLKKKELKEILIKFAEKCRKINPNIKIYDYIKIGMDVIFDTGIDDTRSLIRILHYEIVKLNRIYCRSIEVDKIGIEPIPIEEFIKKIDSELLKEIRRCRKYIA